MSLSLRKKDIVGVSLRNGRTLTCEAGAFTVHSGATLAGAKLVSEPWFSVSWWEDGQTFVTAGPMSAICTVTMQT